ncbi:MAG TPA: Na+/H+ antiporter NhaA [Chthoniobacterales bacterium]|nr:Na+/H+ antiporter NhaA [Chthoniobacterales bacterium]
MQRSLQLPGATSIERLTKPFEEFARLESSGGILLIACTVVALLWANSPWGDSYFTLWHTRLTVGFARAALSKEIHFWINDGLMAVFFLLVGLEIKREVLIGELASLQKAALPLVGALGGMLIPAGFYLLFNRQGAGAAGWGVPMATDIAFALGVLALLDDRVPTSVKVFLAALAIADDIGAVLVIAFFYTAEISWISLAVAGGFFLALIVMNRIGVRHAMVYVVLGMGLWLAFLQSGIHATVAGVLLALTVPAHRRLDGAAFLERSQTILEEFRSADQSEGPVEASATRSAALSLLAQDCHYAEAPMLRFEHALAPWIKHGIMPIFALANAGVYLGGGAFDKLVSPISLGVICGLALGKPLGIVSFAWLAVRGGMAALPARVNWRQIIGAGMLGGIGFTMSLFIASLAFGGGSELETAKVGILAASVVAGVAGVLVILQGSQPNDMPAQPSHPPRKASINSGSSSL